MTPRGAPSRPVLRRLLPAALVAAGLLATTTPPAAPAATAPAPAAEPKRADCLQRVNDTYAELVSCVAVPGIRMHQRALQAIADANDDPSYPGTRTAGTKGYADSVRYVASALRRAGYDVTLDRFRFDFVFPAVLEQLTPVARAYRTGTFTNSGDGEVTGSVIPVDVVLAPPRDPVTSGCEAADFDGLDFGGPNDIALIQRGTCTFADKAVNAEAAGAEAVVIFNQGNAPDRQDLIVGTLDPATPSIPVVGASFADGRRLAREGSTATIEVRPSERRTTTNVLAERVGRRPGNVVVAGAHLDGINNSFAGEASAGQSDNGTGASALLETALMMAKVRPSNTVRFAFWGAEELGLLGSEAYVADLSPRERRQIALYLNYDMVGSPNYITMIYDADQSSFPAPEGVPIPRGSVAIENLFERWYTRRGLPYDDAVFSGRSDYQAFIEAGIPSGGLFTGAEVVKTEEQAAIWGGDAGEQFDPCYHDLCDTLDNVSLEALDQNSNAMAFAQLTFAYSTERVNGVPGRRVPDARPLPAPAGPEGTFLP